MAIVILLVGVASSARLDYLPPSTGSKGAYNGAYGTRTGFVKGAGVAYNGAVGAYGGGSSGAYGGGSSGAYGGAVGAYGGGGGAYGGGAGAYGGATGAYGGNAGAYGGATGAYGGAAGAYGGASGGYGGAAGAYGGASGAYGGAGGAYNVAGGAYSGAGRFGGAASGPFIPILSYENNPNQGDGSYSWSYVTANEIRAQEEGYLNPNAPEGPGEAARGSFSFIAPDGQQFTVTYTADENGFVPQGAHLPTPPPIPQEILESLQKNAADEAAGIYDDGSYREEGAVTYGGTTGGYSGRYGGAAKYGGAVAYGPNNGGGAGVYNAGGAGAYNAGGAGAYNAGGAGAYSAGGAGAYSAGGAGAYNAGGAGAYSTGAYGTKTGYSGGKSY